MVKIKNRPITLSIQKEGLQHTYEALIEKIEEKRGKLICIMNLQPTLESEFYKVKICYAQNKWRPQVWLLSPKLVRKPEHLYGSDKFGNPCLCVYTPKEWNPTKMTLAKVFVPWIVTWLYAYEAWVITGKWLYQSTPHPSRSKKKQVFNRLHNYR